MEIERIVGKDKKVKKVINPKDNSINLPINYNLVNFNANNLDLESRNGAKISVRNINGVYHHHKLNVNDIK